MVWQEQQYGAAFARKRVLITGGAGFIGSHLASALSRLGSQVVVIDDLSGGLNENLQGIESAQLVRGSILDEQLLHNSMTNCEFVFHEAALGSVPRSVEFPRKYQDTNSLGTMNVLEAARVAGVKRVLFAASSSAYGLNPVPWVESMPTLPKSPYAATKVAGEALLRAYSGSYGLDAVSLRYFNVFGPRQNANSAYAAVIAAFAKSVLNGQPPVIFGDGNQTRDFTYVDNVVHANLLAASSPQPLKGDVINVGCGGQISVNELAKIVASMLGQQSLSPIYKPARTGDISHSFADLSRAERILAYRPIVGIREGLEITLNWYRSSLSASAN